MKNTSLFLSAMAGIALIVMPSCKKEMIQDEKQPISESVSANLNKDESYAYSLPAASGPEEFKIVKQSEHGTISQIEKDASGNMVYNYTPATGFTGTDQVVIANGKEGPPQGKCGPPNGAHPAQGEHHEESKKHHPKKRGHHHGGCHKGQKHMITINFIVVDGAVISE